jgi:antibiotic biosynthesis monooxygenase (ABM) superfamily enzyme
MYGTVARLRVKHGMEARLLELDREDQARNIPGFVGEYLYRMDADPSVYYLAVAFSDKDAYVANATSAEQDALYRRFRELLDADPEWNDGEVVSVFQPR